MTIEELQRYARELNDAQGGGARPGYASSLSTDSGVASPRSVQSPCWVRCRRLQSTKAGHGDVRRGVDAAHRQPHRS